MENQIHTRDSLSLENKGSQPVIAPESLRAVNDLPGTLSLCSQELGWCGLLLRRYEEPVEADFETKATDDQLLVLVTRGETTIESRSSGGWRSADLRRGDLGMTPPGEVERLRFFGPAPHQTLQLHIPTMLLAELGDEAGKPFPRFDTLRVRHDPVTATITCLGQALEQRLPAIYAESATRFLVMQMFMDAGALQPKRMDNRANLNRLEAYMQAHISDQISLADMAGELAISVYQLIRLCKSVWGLTPLAYLTSMRMEHGGKLLASGTMPVLTVAEQCGYENPSHFATAFRRHHGVSPTAYRKIVCL